MSTQLATTSDAVGRWHIELQRLVEADDLAAYSATTYRTGLSKYLAWCSENQAAPASRESVLLWLGSARTYEPATTNTWLSGVRAFFAWAVAEGLLAESPTEKIRGRRRTGTTQRHKRDTLTDEEVRRLLTAPDPTTHKGLRDRAILHLFAYNALRRIEVCRAEVEDLHTESNRLLLDVRGKGRTDAAEFVVLAHDGTVTAVYDWLAARGPEPGPLFWSVSRATLHQRLAPRSVQYIVKGYFALAGIFGRRKTVHSLRHTAITNALRNGAPLQKVQSMARHADVKTTLIYVHELDRLDRPAEDFVSYGKKPVDYTT